MNTLRIKTWRDLWLYRARTALVVIAIAVGVAAGGVATTSLIVLRRDLREGYAATNPAHAILDVTYITDGLAGQVADLPEVAGAEIRRSTPARLALDGESRPLQLWTLPDFTAATIGKLRPEAGAVLPPPEGAVLLERSAGTALGIAPGDALAVRLMDGDEAQLTVAGFVHDLAVAPTTVQPGVYGYMTDATAARLGLPEAYNQLYLTVAAADPDRAAVEVVASAVGDWLEDEGAVVTRATIPEPDVHLMQGNVDTGLLMIGILGGLTLLLGAFLVTNVMSAVVAQQVPIIGVLKALGGGRGLVLRHYGLMVLIFGLLALLLAVPLGLFGAYFMSSFLAGQLNFDIPSFGLPWPTMVVQLAGALLVPALAALGPVRVAAGLTIRQALTGTTSDERQATSKESALNSSRVVRHSSLVLVVWRNVARRKGRLALTLAALSLAGALFMATFGLRLGLESAIEILVSEFPYDVQIDFAGAEAGRLVDRVAQEASLAHYPGDLRIEMWGVADARRVYSDGRVGSSFTLFGVPATTRIAPFAEGAGQWLDGDGLQTAGETGEVYINYEAEKLIGWPAVEEALVIRVNGDEDRELRLVGMSLRPFDAQAYVPYPAFEAATGRRGEVGRVVVYLEEKGSTADGELSSSSLQPLSSAAETAVAGALVSAFETAGMPVARSETATSIRDGYRAQFNNLVVLLMALATLTALVGGLGLANTMALNVLERSREIGVLRAIGARRPLLRRLVLAEGLAVALFSAFFAVILALPLTLALDRVMGVSLLGSPLAFAFSPAAALGWLGLVVVIGLAACWLPAEGAARMTIREALAYG